MRRTVFRFVDNYYKRNYGDTMKRKNKIVFLFPIALLLFSFSAATADTAEPKEADEEVGFIGAETCTMCHEEQYDSYSKSVHFKESIKGPQSQDACESCHGAGAMHVEEGGGRGVAICAFDQVTDPKAKAARCLVCHERTPGMDLWEFGAHARNDVSCDDCHVLHAGGRQKPNAPEVCFGCHRDIKIEANKRSHHPIIEDKVGCFDCHLPHGSAARKNIKAEDSQQLCFKCHADKRGPYVWEHPPVAENCLTCHSSHGSNHAKLLNERLPQLCQNCHDWSRHPGTAYDNNASRTSRVDCLRCHLTVHGSNSPAGGGMRWVR
jgi:DmsE family decaheme c-type cytochrome